MKITCERKSLADAMAAASAVVNARHPNPFLHNVKFDASKNDGVMIRATDLELSVQVAVPDAGVAKPGCVLLPAQKLSALLRDLRGETVTIELTGNDQVMLTAGPDVIRLDSSDPEGFPTLPEFPSEATFLMPASVLESALAKTSKSIATDKGRYALNGVLMTPAADKVEFCGTDGRRLAYVRVDGTARELDYQVILPRRGTDLLMRMLARAPETTAVEVACTRNDIVARIGSDIVSTQLVGGEYPDYWSVIPKANDHKLMVNRDELLGGVRLAQHTTSLESATLTFDICGNHVALTSRASGMGSAEVKVDIEYAQDDLKLAFDPKYLTEGLGLMDNTNITVLLKDVNTGAIFHDGDQAHFFFLVMPIDPN